MKHLSRQMIKLLEKCVFARFEAGKKNQNSETVTMEERVYGKLDY